MAVWIAYTVLRVLLSWCSSNTRSHTHQHTLSHTHSHATHMHMHTCVYAQVAVVSGLSIPLNPSLLMLFTRAVERYVDRRWPSRIPHDDLSRGGRSAQEVLQEEQAKRRLRLQALGAASAPVGAARAATEGAAIRKSGSGHGGAGAGAGPANRSNRSVSRGQAYQI